MSVYDFTVTGKDGSAVSLKDYEGKVLLIINSATQCGFTPQYTDLESIYDKYQEKGFEILDFPCNQFGSQAPGSDEEIAAFCEMRFGIRFPLFHKIDVNGDDADPLFTYLKSQKGYADSEKGGKSGSLKMAGISKLSKTATEPDDIRWNFTKFLVGRNGEVLQRFEPTAKMSLVEEKVAELIG